MLQKLYKTKQFALLFLKMCIVSLAFYFIWYKLFHNNQDNAKLWAGFIANRQISLSTWIILVSLTGFNWFFEVKKWQVLASQIKPINFRKALHQSLSSFTASVFTPNKIGEYGIKSLYFPKYEWKMVVFLNFVGNMAQLSATIFFGVLGLVVLSNLTDQNLNYTGIVWVTGILLIVLLGGYFLKKDKPLLKGYSLGKLKRYFLKLKPKTRWKILLFSIIRYLLFSHQFFLVLMLFGAEISYFEAISAIFSMYLLASALPSVFVFEAVIRGSISLWIFSFFGIENILILSCVGLMWLLNFGIPAIVGSFFVLKFKPENLTAA